MQSSFRTVFSHNQPYLDWINTDLQALLTHVTYTDVLKVAFLSLYICSMETLHFYNQPLVETDKDAAAT